ncbi:MAG TPA: RidA family protein [Alphaproteobacteria bacterium]|nr:RidA family protein [Alphaproteobacteria bacterium]
MITPRKAAMNPEGVAKPLKPHYSNAVRVTAGPLLFVAGQVAVDPEGKIIGKGDLRVQAVQVLENIRLILRAHAADMEDVVSVTVYVTDIRAFNEIADIRLRYFPKDGPASAIVEVSRLALPELLVEISAVAAVP